MCEKRVKCSEYFPDALCIGNRYWSSILQDYDNRSCWSNILYWYFLYCNAVQQYLGGQCCGLVIFGLQVQAQAASERGSVVKLLPRLSCKFSCGDPLKKKARKKIKSVHDVHLYDKLKEQEQTEKMKLKQATVVRLKMQHACGICKSTLYYLCDWFAFKIRCCWCVSDH